MTRTAKRINVTTKKAALKLQLISGLAHTDHTLKGQSMHGCEPAGQST